MNENFKIGVFDSGFGGLTVFKSIFNMLPEYNYIYLGDNARAPYGDHSFETIYNYTLECVEWLFQNDCQLVILACNTASAKALRTIQQKVLPLKYPDRRVLGVIRPTAEVIGNYSRTGKIGIFGTRGTISSNSYPLEIHKFFPHVQVFQQSCPMWVPLIENKEHESDGAGYFLKKYSQQLRVQSGNIDTILLGCTHYPLLKDQLLKLWNSEINIIAQGDLVASSLKNYLLRHPEITTQLSKSAGVKFFTTGNSDFFNSHASIFFGKEIESEHVSVI